MKHLKLITTFFLGVFLFPNNVLGQEGPTVEIWYEDDLRFGHIGISQVWVNILGNVSDPDGVKSLSYKLNDGDSSPLSVGLDDRRLENDGDFNIDIDIADLNDGVNAVTITAVDNLDNTSEKTLSFNYTSGKIWPVDYAVSWDTVANIQNALQVVDGLWTIGADGIRPTELGYDRIIAFGDTLWRDCEVTVPIKVHGLQGSFGPFSHGYGLGVVLRWLGHTDNPIPSWQPKAGWLPQGGTAWLFWDVNGENPKIQIAPAGGNEIKMDFNAVFDVTYIFKARIETVDTGTDFRMKIWDEAQPEPANWTLETVDTDFKGLEKGSALFVAHHVDVSFGDFTVVPLNDYPPIVSFDPTSNDEEPLKIDLDASASVDPDGNIASYEWDFGDGNSGSGVTASHTYDAHGDYTITLTVTDDDGLKSSTSFLFIPFQDLTFQSDDFNVETLNEEIWRFEDELGNATIELTGFDTGSATFDLTIPGDNEHSLWFDDSSAPRLMQRINDEDFEVELKFEPTFSDKFQIQGIMVEGLSDKVIRYDFFYDGSDIRNFAATMTMNTTTVDIQYNAAVSKDLESDLFLKVKREGDDWTLYYALTEGNWVESSSFTYPMEVRAVGVFGGNEKPDDNSNPPGHKVVVDYFFNSASPIDPEDGEEMVTGIDDEVIKDEPVLFQNYPNPVSESTHLEFNLPEAGSVSLSINDYLGRRVSEIVKEDMIPGKHIISWSPENLKNGLYYGQLKFRSKVKSKQMASTIKIIILK